MNLEFEKACLYLIYVPFEHATEYLTLILPGHHPMRLLTQLTRFERTEG